MVRSLPFIHSELGTRHRRVLSRAVISPGPCVNRDFLVAVLGKTVEGAGTDA